MIRVSSKQAVNTFVVISSMLVLFLLVGQHQEYQTQVEAFGSTTFSTAPSTLSREPSSVLSTCFNDKQRNATPNVTTRKQNTRHVISSPLFQSSSSSPPAVILTEETILKRNQGYLEMAKESERTRQLNHQRDLAEQRKNDPKESDQEEEGHYNFDIEADQQGFGSVLMTNGVARINNVLSQSTSSCMLTYVNQLLKDTTAAVESGIFPHSSLFGTVHAKKNRWDLLLPLEASDYVMDCLREILLVNENDDNSESASSTSSPVASVIESILGKDAELYELSAMISDPGAPHQPLHPDIIYQDTIHPILTCFVALQDIDPDMGPTIFMPQTANIQHHEDLQNRHLDPNATGLVATARNEIGTLGQGDCSLYSAMTLHCGSANKSEKRRCLFYFSFRNNSVYRDGCRSSSSLRSELKERALTLREIQDFLRK